MHPELTPTEREFLGASKALADAEEQAAAEDARRQQQINRRLRGLLAGVAVLTIIALIATANAFEQGEEAAAQRNLALRQRNEAVALSLAAAARDAADTNAALALALAAESSAATSTPLRQAFGALAQADLAFDKRTQPVRGPISGYARAWSVAFSPNSRLVASAGQVADRAEVRLWDVASGHRVGDSFPGYDMAFSPTEHVLATVAADGVRLRNFATGRPVGKRLLDPPGRTRTVDFAPQGDVLATGGNKGVQFWNPRTGQKLRRLFTEPAGKIVAMAFSPDGQRLATMDRRGTLRIWSPRDPYRAAVEIPDLQSDRVQDVAFISNGVLASSGEGGAAAALRLWNPITGQSEGAPLQGRATGAVSAFALDPRGELVATADGDQTLRLWNRVTGAPVEPPLRGHTRGVSSVAFSPDGNLLASAGRDGTVRLWDPPNGDPSRASLRHPGGAASVAFSGDDKLLASSGANEYSALLELWDPDTGNHVPGPDLKRGSADSIAFRAKTHEIATSDANSETVRLWDLDRRKPLRGEIRHRGVVRALAFSPGGSLLATASSDGSLRLWNPSTRRAIEGSIGAESKNIVRSVAFSPDGRVLAAGGDEGVVRLWDTTTRAEIGDEIAVRTGGVTSVAFSPDGHRLAIGGVNGTVRLWDVVTRHFIDDPTEDHTAGVSVVAFSPDGRLLATGADDGTVRFWDPRNGDPIGGPFPAHSGRVDSIAFRPHGGQFATVGFGTVHIWNLSVSAACAISTKYVTRTQLRPFFPSEWRAACRYAD